MGGIGDLMGGEIGHYRNVTLNLEELQWTFETISAAIAHFDLLRSSRRNAEQYYLSAIITVYSIVPLSV
jgi:hypothetical protein